MRVVYLFCIFYLIHVFVPYGLARSPVPPPVKGLVHEDTVFQQRWDLSHTEDGDSLLQYFHYTISLSGDLLCRLNDSAVPVCGSSFPAESISAQWFSHNESFISLQFTNEHGYNDKCEVGFIFYKTHEAQYTTITTIKKLKSNITDCVPLQVYIQVPARYVSAIPKPESVPSKDTRHTLRADIVYTESNGTISLPNYDNNLNLYWLIVPASMDNATQFISIQVGPFASETGIDFLEIYNGPNAILANRLSRLSGNRPTGITVNATRGSAYIRFFSDSSDNAAGFTLTWSVVTNTTASTSTSTSVSTSTSTSTTTGGAPTYTPSGEFTTNSGSIVVPNYQNNLRLTWRISPANFSTSNQVINIQIPSLRTEEIFDYLEVFDGPDAASVRLDKISGNRTGISINGSTDSLFLRFYSDDSTNDLGFSLTWNVLAKEVVPTLAPSPSPTPSPTIVLTQISGSITISPYTNNQDRYWLIAPSSISENQFIRITFAFFGTEDIFDYLDIYDGPDAIPSKRIVKLSGYQTPGYTLNGNASSIFLRFHSDDTTIAIGFSLTWNGLYLE